MLSLSLQRKIFRLPENPITKLHDIVNDRYVVLIQTNGEIDKPFEGEKRVQVGNDLEKATSERNFHSKIEV